jgi:uncharacterized membrane protein
MVLLTTFVMALLVIKLLRKRYEWALSGRIALAVMLFFTASAHFTFTKGMTMMIPDFIPFKTAMIYLTGVVEILAAIALLIPSFRVAAGWVLIVLFVLLLPANIYAAIKHVDYQSATYTGPGLGYLWFRVPLQLLFIVWAYLSAVKP